MSLELQCNDVIASIVTGEWVTLGERPFKQHQQIKTFRTPAWFRTSAGLSDLAAHNTAAAAEAQLFFWGGGFCSPGLQKQTCRRSETC